MVLRSVRFLLLLFYLFLKKLILLFSKDMLNWSKTDLGLEWNLWIYLEWNIYNEIFEYFFHSKHLVGSSSIKTALETI